MIGSLLNKAGLRSSTDQVQNTGSSEPPKSRAARTIEAADERLEKLHAKAIPSPKFKKISANDTGLESELQKILKRYKTDSDEYHKAALSKDGKTLVLAHDGITTLAQNFGGATSASRLAYKVTGLFAKAFGAPEKDIATAQYKKFFNEKNPADKDVSMVHEPIAHLFKGLATNHYHGVSVFHKDEKTGKFTKAPSAISIIDSYKFIFEEHEKGNEMPDTVKAKKSIFEDAYALDKTIPIDMERAKNFGTLYNEIAEGLYQAQGYTFLTIPGQIHKTLNANTDDLNYVEMPWHRVQQGADQKWKVMANKKEFDESMFENEADKKFYDSRTMDTEHTNITIVRPKAQATEPIEPFIGYMENWSQMYSGNALRAKDKDDRKLVDLAQSISTKYIETYNAEYI